MSIPAFAYLQARLQARHARFLDLEGWQRLETAPTYEMFLKQARMTPLEGWLHALPAETTHPVETAHALERWLGERFRHHVEEVAAWMPKSWRPAVRWLHLLPLLPAMRHLLSGQPPLPWMTREPLLAPLLKGSTPHPTTPDPTPLLAAARTAPSLLEAWSGHWRGLWPEVTPALDALARQVQEHLADFARSGSAEGAWKARQTLGMALTMGFRRHSGTPAAGFLHLALTALELERLRGALVRRALFDGKEGVP